MVLSKRLVGSRRVALAAVFTALVFVLDSVPMLPGFYGGIWDSWIFLLSPLVGVILGPYMGFSVVLTGSFLGHALYFRDVFEFVYMLGAALGSGMAGFVFREQWKPVLGIYSALLMFYLLYPISWSLPMVGVWDVLIGYAVVLVFSASSTREMLHGHGEKRLAALLALSGLIGLESDVLLRVVLFVPGQTYWLFYGFSPSQLVLLWLAAGVITPIKVVLGTTAVVMVGLALLRSLNTMELELAS